MLIDLDKLVKIVACDSSYFPSFFYEFKITKSIDVNGSKFWYKNGLLHKRKGLPNDCFVYKS